MKTTTIQERVEKQKKKNRCESIKVNKTRVTLLKNQGMSDKEIADYMDIPESSVRALVYYTIKDQMIINTVVDILKDSVDKKGYTNISVGVEKYLGVSRTKLKEAIVKLESLEYTSYYFKKDLLGLNKETTIKLLAKPNLSYKEVYSLYEQYGL